MTCEVLPVEMQCKRAAAYKRMREVISELNNERDVLQRQQP